MKNLVKEIITTETEKFTEDGKIKERVKETREKIYEKITEKEEADAQVEETEVEESPPVKKEETSTLIEDAAKAIDSKKAVEETPKKQESEPSAGYNVVSRTTPYPMGPNINAAPAQFTPPVFPWEKDK